MFIFLNYEQLIEIYSNLGFDISTFNEFQQIFVLLGSNFFYLCSWIFIISLAYKIILRVLRFF